VKFHKKYHDIKNESKNLGFKDKANRDMKECVRQDYLEIKEKIKIAIGRNRRTSKE